MTQAGHTTIGNVIHPVDDIGAAVDFYAAIGIPVKFQDGDRYAALDAGTTLALTAGSEDLTNGRTAISFRVADVDAAAAAVLAAGGTVLTAAHDGPHERRAVLEDPWHNIFVVYRRLDQPPL